MILRLEHVEHVRPERLRGLHDVRAGRIASCPATVNARGRAMDGHAGLDQRVDELGRGREVGLIRRQDVAARIAQAGIAQELLELRRRAAATAAAAAAGIRLVAGRRRPAAASATAAERASLPR